MQLLANKQRGSYFIRCAMNTDLKDGETASLKLSYVTSTESDSGSQELVQPLLSGRDS